MEVHKKYIARCFELANLSKYQVKSNPNVGAVLVYQNRIIGEGWHEYFGGPHAEVNAINSVKEGDRNLIPQSTLYVSLEPCCIVSKTPACTDLILEHNIKKVVVSVSDPNPKMNGQSFKLLREKGVDVIENISTIDGHQLIAPFKAGLKKRPYIILKFAQSSEGYMAVKGKNVWLSNKYSRILAHKWRSESEGILVGHNTVRIDNPKLNTRLYPGKDPVPIVFSNNPSDLKESYLLNKNTNTIFVGISKNENGYNTLNNISQMVSKDSLLSIMEELYSRGIHSILVEGGPKTLKLFNRIGLWDEARVIKTPVSIEKGIRAPSIKGALIRRQNIHDNVIEYIQNS